SRCPTTRSRTSASSYGRRWSAPTTSIRRSRSRSVWARTGPRSSRKTAANTCELYFPTVLASSDLMQQEPGVWVAGPDGNLIPDYEWTFPEINEGGVVHGTVVRVDKDEVLVDIGYKSEGVIPVAELSIRRSINPADEVSVGDEIDALVLTKEDAEGRLI